MLGALMPETTIHEDCDLLFMECKIRPTENCRMAAPTHDTVSAEERDENLLGLAVPFSPYSRHDL